MAQDTGKILPLFLQVDNAFDKLKPEESPYICGLSFDINANPGSDIGTANPSGEGSNQFVLTPSRSNLVVPDVLLPDTGWNKNIGTYESKSTKELYFFTYNSELNHCIHVLNGDTGVVSKVVQDPKLAFTDDQEGFIADIRVSLRYVKDKDGNITEKHLVWTNGKKWQGWVNVVAAIATDGFDAALFPYWTLLPPHFDREELLEWAVRPPMVKPEIQILPNTAADLGKINRIADKAFRFAIARQNTDGRVSTLSPYSLPLTVKTEEYLNNTDNLPKSVNLLLEAGSPLTEKLLIFVQRAGVRNTLDSLSVWGDWILYDTIEKFDTAATGAYWTRTNPWASFDYDPIFNTIKYNFDNSKVGTIISQQDAMRLQTGMPQISQALADMDDAVILSNNRYGYNNFSKALLAKLSVLVKEKEVTTCSRPLRTIYLYAYIGQRFTDSSFTSQVGYTLGTDTKVRFGGLRMADVGTAAYVDTDEAKSYELDFADKQAFRVYLKGTPYFADGEWIIVKSDNSIEVIDDLFDYSTSDAKVNTQTILDSGSYFACRFKLVVPAGRYIATLGRHNIPSNGDYRGTSTYIYGIGNSRVKSTTSIGNRTLVSIKPNCIGTYSKEMEIDCVNGNVDVWGNNADLFYVYCPYRQGIGGNGKYRFIEGYFRESSESGIPVEKFPYSMTGSSADDWGKGTDKNGFYWAFTKVVNSDQVNIRFDAKIDCAFPTGFVVPTSQTGIGWKRNAVAYLASYNDGIVGDCNRIIYNGRVTDLTGLIGYANIGVSIKDGQTVYSRTDGTFTLIIHNGGANYESRNVYVNAGGNFLVTLDGCGQIPLSIFDESLSPCINCDERIYPVPLNLNVVIENNTQVSLKEGGKYNIGIVGADLAGRLMYVNVIQAVEVSTFLERDNINATYFQLLINGALNMLAENPDIKWVSPYVSKNVINKRYVQWVGDRIVYLDNSGNVVNDPTTAVFIKIVIDSLYDANITNNFSLLSTYQFAKEDRLRIYDDGDGELFDVATYGDPIDVQVLGTNYNQAAINAGLLLPQTNTVLDNNQTTNEEEVGLIVRYDARLDRVDDKTGFWIEVYSPVQENDVIPFFEVAGFYPVINGEIARFTGYDISGNPTYSYPVTIDLDFWDTYYLQRNISGKYFSHPFESPNVTDNWGANITSGGRLNVENKDARQYWVGGDVARSDQFMKNGITNGLATFRDENRKNYGIYPRGEIISSHTRGNDIIFNCANDWFRVQYNMPYTKASKDGGLVVTNLDENLSLPMEKRGAEFGMEKKDIGTLVVDDDLFFWFDRKNTAVVKSNYGGAIDITEMSEGERGGIQSYINAKTYFINKWDNSHEIKDRFDVVFGIDGERGNLYVTFRPRRSNTNGQNSYVNQRRNLDVKHQETFVYSIQYSAWIPCVNFTPESYGRLRGSDANVEFFAFAAGKPYYHNNTPNNNFLNFFGVQCEPVIMGVFNKDEDVKIFGSISYNCHGSTLFADFIFDEQTNSFSYIPVNLWKEKEHINYAEILRDMASYPPVNPEELFRSMLFCGKRVFGDKMLCRFVQNFEDLGKYFQLSGISCLYAKSFTNKP